MSKVTITADGITINAGGIIYSESPANFLSDNGEELTAIPEGFTYMRYTDGAGAVLKLGGPAGTSINQGEWATGEKYVDNMASYIVAQRDRLEAEKAAAATDAEAVSKAERDALNAAFEEEMNAQMVAEKEADAAETENVAAQQAIIISLSTFRDKANELGYAVKVKEYDTLIAAAETKIESLSQ